MSCPIFSARFISGDPAWAPVCPVFRKSFSVGKAVKGAKLYISALGIYEAFINGERVGNDYMEPGWTNYKKRVQYLDYDVTDMIKADNELRIGVGNGWYSSRGGFPDTKNGMYNLFPALICALEIVYADGSKDTVVTDESWEAARSEVTFSGIYDGETCDATYEPTFTEKARVFDYSYSNLIPLEGERIKETETVYVKEIIRTPEGDTVLDFGQEITGNLCFTLENANGGEMLEVNCCEILDKNGNFYTENYRTALSRIIYTAKQGRQSYKAHYTFFGFRYIRLVGWCEEVKKENFKATVLHSDMKRTGYFKCGHEKINKLYSNVIWGQRDNFLDIPTDCPQRDERLGWTGDAQVFARTASINYDTERFYTKWLRDVMSEQLEDGSLPHVVPHVLSANNYNSAAWSDCACIIPWEIYTAYGNKKLLKEHLPLMKKWVGYMYNAPGKKYLWQNGKHFGDWLGLDAPEGSYTGSTSKDLIASAYYYLSTTLLVKALRALGYKEAEKYERLAGRIKNAYLKEFVKRGRLVSDTQTAHVVTLHFGLADGDEDLKKKLAERLVQLIEERGDSLTTGFVGTPYLLDTLTEIGRADKAYTLLYREEFPSWLFSVNMGATTIWEHWDGLRNDGSVWSKDMNSFNHYAYGSVAAWFYRVILGIKPTSKAYDTIELSPIPSRKMGFAKGKIETRHGTVVSEWVYEGDVIRYTFAIPDGTVAVCKLTDGTEIELTSGVHTLFGKANDIV